MKDFGLDWAAFLDWVPAWEMLSPASREALLGIGPQGVPRSSLGEAAAALERAGMAEDGGARGTLLAVPARLRPFTAALASMARHPLFAAPGDDALAEYLAAHLAPWDAQRILEGGHGTLHIYRSPRQLVERTTSAARVEEFLALGGSREALAWEKARSTPAAALRLGAPGVLPAAQGLVRALAGLRRPVPLRELASLAPETDPAVLAPALGVLVHSLIAFPALVPGTLQAVVGLWPSVARRLTTPEGPPPPVAAAEVVSGAWRVEDMAAVLVEAAAQPLRLRGADGGIFARAVQVISERLLPLPAWLVPVVSEHEENGPGGRPTDSLATERVETAATVLDDLHYLRVAGRAGLPQRLEATAAGKAWLALSGHRRLEVVLEALRRSPQRNPASWYIHPGKHPFFPARLTFDADKAGLDLRAALEAALLSLPGDGMVPLDDFLTHHARARNPLLDPAARAALERQVPRNMLGREAMEDAWTQLLRSFVAHRLAPLGGARMGRTEEGEIAVGLTGAGRYLLGAADAFEEEREVEGAAVVQPDFEVVFLAPAPRAEAEVSRFAERKGTGWGATLRITRPAVLRAAEQGMTTADILATLEAASATPLPPNVTRQIGDWLAAIRQVRVAPAVLVECPDPDTATRTLAAAGKDLELLSPTLLRLRDSSEKARNALVKKLRAQGIFLE